jgi:hypothetical protein
MSSPFASLTVSDRIPLPFDEGQWIQVRKLTGRECERAQEAHRGNLTTSSPRSWAATFRRMLEQGKSDPEVLQAIRDPLTGYDRFTLIRCGLVRWSYPHSLTPPLTPGAGTDYVDDLDDEAVDFIATEVLRVTKPALFHATEEDAAVEKKTG